MPDIDLRFHKDMLVLSSPAVAALARMGIDTARDTELTMLLEPDTLEDAYRLESAAGAQCLVACTTTLTPARLAHVRMVERAPELARIALEAVQAFKPQHALVELAPCGLPLDGSSANSLKENRDQYARAGRLFAGQAFDAFFLNGFTAVTDLKCALMGLRKVSDAPVFASVDVQADGMLVGGRGTLEEAVAVMDEYGASAAGISCAAPLADAVALTRRLTNASPLPVLVQLEVRARDARQQAPTEENPYYVPDTMVEAAEALRAAGAQFLRATGDAVPSYTGALAATTTGMDVARVPAAQASRAEAVFADDGMADLVARAQARVAQAIGKDA